jgi:hypothetical protein
MFGRKNRKGNDPDPGPASTDWSDIENVRAEWPRTGLALESDLASWREGWQLYDDREDHASMIRCGGLMARALQHELYGTGFLSGSDLPNTVYRTLFASTFAPPDQQTFGHAAQAQTRLALTVVKKHGWQSTAEGGNGMFDELLQNTRMLLMTAIGPQDRPWEGNLKAFYADNPIQVPDAPAVAPGSVPVSSSPSDEGLQAIGEVQRSLAEADVGDGAANVRVRALAADMAGDHATALALHEEAGTLGDVGSMFDAGCLARDQGAEGKALYWFEAAAAAGHASSMFNLATIAHQRGDLATAVQQFERAGHAGLADAFGALTQIASDAGDDENEFRWSGLGADAGQPFCLVRHGQLLMQRNADDPQVLRNRVVPMLTRAAEAGQDGALFLIGIAHAQSGDRTSAKVWLLRAEAAGDSDATRVMRQHGL